MKTNKIKKIIAQGVAKRTGVLFKVDTGDVLTFAKVSAKGVVSFDHFNTITNKPLNGIKKSSIKSLMRALEMHDLLDIEWSFDRNYGDRN